MADGKKAWDRVIDIGKYVLSAMILPALFWGISMQGKVQILQEKQAQNEKHRKAAIGLLSERLEYLKSTVRELKDGRKVVTQNTLALTKFGEKLNGLTKALEGIQSLLRNRLDHRVRSGRRAP